MYFNSFKPFKKSYLITKIFYINSEFIYNKIFDKISISYFY